MIDQLAAASSSTSNKELVELIKANRREKRTAAAAGGASSGGGGFQKITLVQVQVDDEDIDEAAAAQDELDADFNPLEGIQGESGQGVQYLQPREGFPYSCRFVCLSFALVSRFVLARFIISIN